MKSNWVLTVRTSLPEVCENNDDLKTTSYVFGSFEKARDATRKVLKNLASEDNSMVDEDGNLIYLREFLDEVTDEECEEREILEQIHLALRDIFMGKDAALDIEEDEYTDCAWITFCYEDGALKLFGDYDGPVNGYDPHIRTNMFSMKDEKDYYLHIDDMFGQDASSELYLDLKKAEPFAPSDT